jgi:antirestriction protein ArdC
MNVSSFQNPKPDVYQRITDQIVSAIEAGAGSVEMPWHRSGLANVRPTNALTGNAYQGVNIISLWAASELKSYASGYWATFKQWKSLGARVRKDERASPIVFYKLYDPEQNGGPMTSTTQKSEAPANGDTTRWFGRTSWVFNLAQVEGWSPPTPQVQSPADVIFDAEAFVAGTGADIRRGGERACYILSSDCIEMPARELFTGTTTSNATESYYAILFHELTHWTGHQTRLDRQMATRFGEQAYAMEELVAELGASFVCAECGITNRPRPDHADYIAHWLDVMKADKRAIFTAASKAGEAASYLIDLQSSAEKLLDSFVEGGVR